MHVKKLCCLLTTHWVTFSACAIQIHCWIKLNPQGTKNIREKNVKVKCDLQFVPLRGVRGGQDSNSTVTNKSRWITTFMCVFTGKQGWNNHTFCGCMQKVNANFTTQRLQTQREGYTRGTERSKLLLQSRFTYNDKSMPHATLSGCCCWPPPTNIRTKSMACGAFVPYHRSYGLTGLSWMAFLWPAGRSSG